MNYDWKSKTKVQADSKLNILLLISLLSLILFFTTQLAWPIFMLLFSPSPAFPVQTNYLDTFQSSINGQKIELNFFSRRRRTRQWKHVWQFCSLEWAKSRSFWRRIEQKSRLQPSCQPTAEQYRRRYIFFFVFFVLPTKYNDAEVPWWIQQWKASYTGTTLGGNHWHFVFFSYIG